jgi:hypothetical protein
LPLSFAKSPLSLNPSAAGYRFFYLSDPSIAPSKKETVRFVGSSRQQKKDHDSSQRAVASSVYWGKIKKTFLSLPERRAENALGRFPGLGFNLLAAPSHQLLANSDLRCGFRRHYSGGTAPDFHRSSLTP